MVTTALPHDESNGHRQAGKQSAEYGRGRPPAARALDDRPQDQTEAAHGEDRAERVSASGGVIMGLGDEYQCPNDAHHYDGDVDEEDRAPPELRQEETPGDRPHGNSQPDGRGPDPDCPGSLARLPVEAVDDG